jgi:hypothetical protein
MDIPFRREKKGYMEHATIKAWGDGPQFAQMSTLGTDPHDLRNHFNLSEPQEHAYWLAVYLVKIGRKQEAVLVLKMVFVNVIEEPRS